MSARKAIPSKVYVNGQLADLDIEVINEAVKYSWYEDDTGGTKPTEAVVKPNTAKKGAYSFIKAPRYNGAPMEVGPLARMYVMGEETVTQLGEKAFSVLGRHLARRWNVLWLPRLWAVGSLNWKLGSRYVLLIRYQTLLRGRSKRRSTRCSATGIASNISGRRFTMLLYLLPGICPRDDNDQMGPMDKL